MSVIPYIAPWQTGFHRYATQQYLFKQYATFTWSITVPTGQWWRVVSSYALANTAAANLNRYLRYIIQDATITNVYAQAGPNQIPPSSSAHLAVLPGIAASGFTGANADVYNTVPTPDVLWPRGTTFYFDLLNTDFADTFVTAPLIYVEIYTEDYPQVKTTQAVTTPLIT